MRKMKFHPKSINHTEGLIARADRSPSTPAALSLSTKADWHLSLRHLVACLTPDIWRCKGKHSGVVMWSYVIYIPPMEMLQRQSHMWENQCICATIQSHVQYAMCHSSWLCFMEYTPLLTLISNNRFRYQTWGSDRMPVVSKMRAHTLTLLHRHPLPLWLILNSFPLRYFRPGRARNASPTTPTDPHSSHPSHILL